MQTNIQKRYKLQAVKCPSCRYLCLQKQRLNTKVLYQEFVDTNNYKQIWNKDNNIFYQNFVKSTHKELSANNTR